MITIVCSPKLKVLEYQISQSHLLLSVTLCIVPSINAFVTIFPSIEAKLDTSCVVARTRGLDGIINVSLISALWSLKFRHNRCAV